MRTRRLILRPGFVAAFTATALGFGAMTANAETIPVRASGFSPGMTEVNSGNNHIQLRLDESGTMPFCQSAVKQGTEPAMIGPDPKIPYFTVRFAMPVPPENALDLQAAFTGMDTNVFTHNHSPGFAILPNGDALAVYFSTPPGKSESDPSTSFIQARLRYGAEEWDLPELFFKFQNYNDQSGLLWNDNGTIHFFGGGRALSDWAPFKMAVSTNNGSTWTLSLPQLDQPAKDYTAQPITSAFRGGDGAIYFAMDGNKAQSFLWRSTDDGIHWQQMSGRTGGRHSSIVPLDNQGDLLSIGGKNASINGWSPENSSTNRGATWSRSVESPFPPLGSAQRPSMIRLADGDLFFVSDAWLQKKDQAPPKGWNNGDGCFVAISTNNGTSWRVKQLPVQLPNHQYRKYGTLGYVTSRQAPNGVIHVLTTETQPCLHYELNEAWINSDAGDIAPETTGGVVKNFSENYPDGKIRSEWSARICPHGRYLLDGKETDYYEDGSKQHEVTYVSGRKMGPETFWSSEGNKIWSWSHDLTNNTSVWTQYWPNGGMKSQSSWTTESPARDLPHNFFGLVANGSAYEWAENGNPIHACLFTNGIFVGNCAMPKGGRLICMGSMRSLDLIVIALYFAVVAFIGFWFARRQTSTEAYFVARRSIPSWAMGLSVFATIISSITFIAYPGAAFDGNWNQLVPGFMAVGVLLVAGTTLVPFFRHAVNMSAYEYFEKRFGYGARAYSALAFAAGHFSKMGFVLFTITAAICGMTGWDKYHVILGAGIITVFYTLIGGLEAVIWTEVLQGIVKIVGVIVILGVLISIMPGGISAAFHLASDHQKMSLGSFDFNLASDSNFWVMLLYGGFWYLQKYAADQTLVQRYLVAKSDRAALKGVALGAILCVPAWIAFMLVGTLIWAYYQLSSESLPAHLIGANGKVISDEVFPYFLATKIPAGLGGIFIAALFSAAMSSMSSDLNCLSAVVVEDYYRKLRPDSTDRQQLLMGKIVVGVCGIIAIGTGIFIAQKGQSALGLYYAATAIVSAGLAGMFLLAFFSRRANRQGLWIGIICALAFTAWATLTGGKKQIFDMGWNYTWPSVMIGVIAHLIVIVVGYLASLPFPPDKNLKTEWTFWGWRENRRQLGTEKMVPAAIEANS